MLYVFRRTLQYLVFIIFQLSVVAGFLSHRSLCLYWGVTLEWCDIEKIVSAHVPWSSRSLSPFILCYYDYLAISLQADFCSCCICLCSCTSCLTAILWAIFMEMFLVFCKLGSEEEVKHHWNATLHLQDSVTFTEMKMLLGTYFF